MTSPLDNRWGIQQKHKKLIRSSYCSNKHISKDKNVTDKIITINSPEVKTLKKRAVEHIRLLNCELWGESNEDLVSYLLFLPCMEGHQSF